MRDRTVGPLEGFRSRLGRPFTATIKLSDDYEVTFDFGPSSGEDEAEAPDFTGQEPLGPCPKCGSRVFEMPNAYVCEKAVGPDKTCDFRSGRIILQRPIERAQMHKLLAEGKTDLLQFVSARTRRGFSAFLVRQPDGKIGFEFEAKEGKGKGPRAARGGTALRVLGQHPKDKKPVELHAGRYGPYVKHGNVNATVRDRDRVDALTLEEALQLLAEKTGQGVEEPRARAAAAPRRAGAAGNGSAAAKTVARSGVKRTARKASAPAATRVGKVAGALARTAVPATPAPRTAAKKTTAKTTARSTAKASAAVPRGAAKTTRTAAKVAKPAAKRTTQTKRK